MIVSGLPVSDRNASWGAVAVGPTPTRPVSGVFRRLKRVLVGHAARRGGNTYAPDKMMLRCVTFAQTGRPSQIQLAGDMAVWASARPADPCMDMAEAIARPYDRAATNRLRPSDRTETGQLADG